MHIGEAVIAELDRLLGQYQPPVTVPRGFVSAKPQANYLIGHLGASDTARRLGISRDTLRRWITGRQTPSKANARKLDTAYHQVRDPKAREARRRRDRHTAQQRIIASLTSPPPTPIQISGTLVISDDESFRANFADTPRIPVENWVAIIEHWRHRETDEAGEALLDGLRASEDVNVAAHFDFPYDDVTVDVLLRED
jgi:hypothetical protein